MVTFLINNLIPDNGQHYPTSSWVEKELSPLLLALVERSERNQVKIANNAASNSYLLIGLGVSLPPTASRTTIVSTPAYQMEYTLFWPRLEPRHQTVCLSFRFRMWAFILFLTATLHNSPTMLLILTAFGLLHVDSSMEAGACLFSMLIVCTNNCVTVFMMQWLSKFRKSVSSDGCKKSTMADVSSDPTGQSYTFIALVETCILFLFLKFQSDPFM